MSRKETAQQNNNIKVGDKSFESAVDIKYLEMTVTNQNCRKQKHVRSHVLMVVIMNMTAFWDIAPCTVSLK
jgi:hypothetical protein